MEENSGVAWRTRSKLLPGLPSAPALLGGGVWSDVRGRGCSRRPSRAFAEKGRAWTVPSGAIEVPRLAPNLKAFGELRTQAQGLLPRTTKM